MIRVALRANLWLGLAFAGLAVFFLTFLTAAYASLGSDRASASRDLEALGPAFSFILPLPQRLDTSAGYVAWFGFGQFVPIFAFWGALAGSGASRGDEEHGLSEQWLAAGIPRWRLLASQAVAYTVAASAALAVGSVACFAVSLFVGEPIAFAGLLAQSSGVVAVALVFFSCGLLAGQLMPTRRSALGAAAVVLVFLFLANSLSRQRETLGVLRAISPFAASDRIHGAVQGLAFGGRELAVLFGVAAAVALLAGLAFARRDSGATLGRRGRSGALRRLPSTNPLLRRPTLAALYDQRLGLAIWSLAIAWEAFFTVHLAKPFLEALAKADPTDASAAQLRVATGAGHGAPYEGFLGFEWFGGIAALALGVYAITQVARWAGDESDGRLEALLSTPTPRWLVVAERAAALGLGVLLLVAVGHVAFSVATLVYDVDLDGGRMLTSSAMLVPVAGVFGGIGAAASAWRPRVAIALLSAFALLGFMIPFAAPVVRAPEWVNHLSVFDLYGSPLAEGFVAWRAATLVGLAALGFVVALVAIQLRDVGR